ncbi:MAG: hypothetical protein JWQ49_4406 [Edaphobacter sp.]|nr:hypothetical protein [Edaphobacter sp.]
MHNISFMQALGGNTTGNNLSVSGHVLEHANWKRVLEPFWASTPVYATMGNHESNCYILAPESGTAARIARFPTPPSRVKLPSPGLCPTHQRTRKRGRRQLRPDTQPRRFPSYKENVYFYTYGNLAIIVLNSEHWNSVDPRVNGAPEGHVMDQQLKWLDQTIQKFGADPKIDHVFVATHSVMFPSGDHTEAGMWFFGSNDPRPMINGTRTDKAIIERRDQIIDFSINKSKKIIGFLTGSEHNFSTLDVTPMLPIYPDNYRAKKLKIKRPFFVVNNGGGGAYSYAMMNDTQYHTPWIDKFQHCSAPSSMAITHVNGGNVTLDLDNPETFEKIAENVKLR